MGEQLGELPIAATISAAVCTLIGACLTHEIPRYLTNTLAGLKDPRLTPCPPNTSRTQVWTRLWPLLGLVYLTKPLNMAFLDVHGLRVRQTTKCHGKRHRQATMSIIVS